MGGQPCGAKFACQDFRMARCKIGRKAEKWSQGRKLRGEVHANFAPIVGIKLRGAMLACMKGRGRAGGGADPHTVYGGTEIRFRVKVGVGFRLWISGSRAKF